MTFKCDILVSLVYKSHEQLHASRKTFSNSTELQLLPYKTGVWSTELQFPSKDWAQRRNWWCQRTRNAALNSGKTTIYQVRLNSRSLNWKVLIIPGHVCKVRPVHYTDSNAVWVLPSQEELPNLDLRFHSHNDHCMPLSYYIHVIAAT